MHLHHQKRLRKKVQNVQQGSNVSGLAADMQKANRYNVQTFKIWTLCDVCPPSKSP